LVADVQGIGQRSSVANRQIFKPPYLVTPNNNSLLLGAGNDWDGMTA
jgi:hypothetical protein